MTTLAEITEAVAQEFRVDPGDLRGPCRAKEFIPPRHICWHLARQTGRFSMPQIGRYYGGRDHTSISHGLKRFESGCYDDHLEALERVQSALTAVFVRPEASPLIFRSCRGGKRG